MVIDMHVHPIFYKSICDNKEELEFRKDTFGVWKQGPMDWDEAFAEMDFGGIDKEALLPMDVTTTEGGWIVTNEQIAALKSRYPERLIGFASVDPHRKDAADVLIHAFDDLGLEGLKLHPSKQHFSPSDELLTPLYEICLRYDKPIIFHAGVSMEPGTLTKHSHPLEFEEVAFRYPKLRMCLAHFGWPWVREVCMLMLKYPNVYTDTAMLYFDDPRQFYHQCLEVDIGPGWIDRSLRHQIMFGSDDPRLEQRRMIKALRNMDMRESTRELIFGGNALEFIGEAL